MSYPRPVLRRRPSDASKYKRGERRGEIGLVEVIQLIAGVVGMQLQGLFNFDPGYRTINRAMIGSDRIECPLLLVRDASRLTHLTPFAAAVLVDTINYQDPGRFGSRDLHRAAGGLGHASEPDTGRGERLAQRRDGLDRRHGLEEEDRRP